MTSKRSTVALIATLLLMFASVNARHLDASTHSGRRLMGAKSVDPVSGMALPPTVGSAVTLTNATVGAEAIDADSIALKNRVAADKAKVDQALINLDAAFDTYMSEQKAGISRAMASGKKLTPAQSLLNNDSDKTKRKSVFAANLQKIKKLNKESGDFLAHGINEFSALSEQEFADLYLTKFPAVESNNGRKLQQTRTCNSEVAFPFGAVVPPTSVNWQTSGRVTAVKNQGQCGSCASFAAIAATEGAWISKWAYLGYNNLNTDLSEQDLLTCITGNQCNGAWPDWYMDRMTCKGVMTEAQRPYLAYDNDVCLAGTRYTTGAVKWSRAPKTQTGYKQALTHNPMAITIQAGPLQTYTSGIWNCGYLSTAVDHAVTAVGYQNSVLMADGQRWNVMKIKNSWGSNWGESGYTSVRMDCAGRGSLAVYDYGIVPIKG